MNGLNYTSISFTEMHVVVSTSVVRRFVDGFLPWAHCYCVVVPVALAQALAQAWLAGYLTL